ncbi:MAG: 4-hydroxybenzoyl-CoA thioesterase family active site [Firmicutes bacterium]|nr:4-hydroxybenzoyl-CoA thioesterase family active site [Bacillota bacterium]MDI6704844.1 thioesterase family protein [Bacillota bacterium]
MHVWDARVRARYKDTDQMGVVYYGNYYTWFEVGRTEFIRSLGLSYKSLEDKGVMLPVIESHCNYKAPAKYDDLLLIRTKVKELSGARIVYEYQVVREEDEVLLASGYTVHAFTDARTLKPVNLRKRCAEYYTILENSL